MDKPIQYYHIFTEGDPHECELIIEEDKDGDWVKREDVAHLINPPKSKKKEKPYKSQSGSGVADFLIEACMNFNKGDL